MISILLVSTTKSIKIPQSKHIPSLFTDTNKDCNLGLGPRKANQSIQHAKLLPIISLFWLDRRRDRGAINNNSIQIPITGRLCHPPCRNRGARSQGPRTKVTQTNPRGMAKSKQILAAFDCPFCHPVHVSVCVPCIWFDQRGFASINHKNQQGQGLTPSPEGFPSVDFGLILQPAHKSLSRLPLLLYLNFHLICYLFMYLRRRLVN